jgi:hypothetical protein
VIRKRALQLAALALGAVLLGAAVSRISLAELAELFGRGGPALLAALGVYPVTVLFHAIGSSALFSPGVKRGLSFARFYSVRLSGDAVNSITPFLDVGGEPLKVWLLRAHGVAPLEECVTTVFASRVLYVAGEGLLLLTALAAAWDRYPAALVWTLAGGLGFAAAHLGLLVWAQVKGAIRAVPAVMEALERRGWAPGGDAAVWDRIEESLRTFFGRRARDVGVALLWSWAAWLVGLLETVIALRLLGLECSLLDGLVLHAALEAVKSFSFFIPANLGSQEGGLAWAAALLGLSATGGFALSLVKRVRHLVWVAVGLGLWAWDRPKPAVAKG